jgi:hypothetical protein
MQSAVAVPGAAYSKLRANHPHVHPSALLALIAAVTSVLTLALLAACHALLSRFIRFLHGDKRRERQQGDPKQPYASDASPPGSAPPRAWLPAALRALGWRGRDSGVEASRAAAAAAQRKADERNSALLHARAVRACLLRLQHTLRCDGPRACDAVASGIQHQTRSCAIGSRTESPTHGGTTKQAALTHSITASSELGPVKRAACRRARSCRSA